MTKFITSRERMLSALKQEATDYVPCCFSEFSALYQRSAGQEDYIDRQLAMGLDVVVTIGDLPMHHDPAVTTREWREETPGERYPILHKEYRTPAGILKRSVKKSEDWPHGDSVPFISDHIIPRATKQLVSSGENLDALRCLFGDPSPEEIDEYLRTSAETKALSSDRDLAVMAGTAMHGDMGGWLCGIQDLIMLCMDEPDFVHRLLDIIEQWNRKRMALVLEEGVDIYLRRGWYENADFWSPQLYREFMLPILKRDTKQVHAAGARLGYIVSCSSMPLLDLFMEAGVDVLLGIDPAQDNMMDMEKLKTKTADRMALWGGVCGYLTVECGTTDEIRREVQASMSALKPGGGFILAPVTNVREDNECTRRNIDAMIDEWKKLRDYAAG